jgi:hypothetical protein
MRRIKLMGVTALISIACGIPAAAVFEVNAVGPRPARVEGKPGALTPLPMPPCLGDDWCLVSGVPWRVRGDDLDFVYAVGTPGVLLVWENESWTTFHIPGASSLTWAARLTRATIVANDAAGAVFWFDGMAWSRDPEPRPLGDLKRALDGSLWARVLSDETGSAPQHRLVRRDERGWVDPVPPLTFWYFRSYVPLSRDEVWASGMVAEPGRLADVVYRGMSGRWVEVGRTDSGGPNQLSLIDGQLFHTWLGHWTGTGWSPATRPSPQQPRVPDDLRIGCRDLHEVDSTHAWCGGPDRLFVWRDGAWVKTTQSLFETEQPAGAWGTMPPPVWAGGDSYRAWGSGPSDVYRLSLRSVGQLEHFDGERWTRVMLDQPVWSVDGLDVSEVWVAGTEALFRREAGVFQKVVTFSNRGRVLARAVAPGRALLVFNGSLFEYDGTLKTLRSPEGGWAVYDVGLHAGRIVVAESTGTKGAHYRLVELDGASWRQVPRTDLYAGTSFVSVGERLLVSGRYSLTSSDSDPGTPLPSDGELWSDGTFLWVSGEGRSFRGPLPGRR